MYIISGLTSLTLTTYLCFLTFLNFKRLFDELINQYQACLYSLECISHGHSKYGPEILQFWHFLQNWFPFLTCRLQSPAAWKALKRSIPSESAVARGKKRICHAIDIFSGCVLRRNSKTFKEREIRRLQSLYDGWVQIMKYWQFWKEERTSVVCHRRREV